MTFSPQPPLSLCARNGRPHRRFGDGSEGLIGIVLIAAQFDAAKAVGVGFNGEGGNGGVGTEGTAGEGFAGGTAIREDLAAAESER